ncbi:MAG: serine hydrolase [Bacteroidales bacterium]|nr:serine hydrolase [Bacteroidales bacterium]MCF8334070.1 serine hydrolase [Bacteroidales bacterium]
MIDRINFKVLAITILFFVAGFSIEAQNLENKLDRIVRKEYQPKKPGVAILVAKDGEVIYRKAFGTANMELDVAMKPEMVFERD